MVIILLKEALLGACRTELARAAKALASRARSSFERCELYEVSAGPCSRRYDPRTDRTHRRDRQRQISPHSLYADSRSRNGLSPLSELLAAPVRSRPIRDRCHRLRRPWPFKRTLGRHRARAKSSATVLQSWDRIAR